MFETSARTKEFIENNLDTVSMSLVLQNAGLLAIHCCYCF